MEESTEKMRPSPFSILDDTLSISITSVKSDSSYSYYGVVHDKFTDEASIFVSENSDASKSEVKKVLKKFIDLTSKDYLEEKGKTDEKLGAWFTIRMSKPTDEYTVPRWHKDGRMYDSDNPSDVNSKYAITLLGNPTRMMDPQDPLLVKQVLDEQKARMPEFDEADDGKAFWAFVFDKENRKRSAERLKGQKLVDVPKGGIVRFSWGQEDSPVHSEPDMSGDRVFVSVLYGSENEMKKMCEMRGTEYKS